VLTISPVPVPQARTLASDTSTTEWRTPLTTINDDDPVYLSTAQLARELGVQAHTINTWRKRYPPDADDDSATPKPDAWQVRTGRPAAVDELAPMWLTDTVSQWQEWRKHRWGSNPRQWWRLDQDLAADPRTWRT
jgi:hypothetical protein